MQVISPSLNLQLIYGMKLIQLNNIKLLMFTLQETIATHLTCQLIYRQTNSIHGVWVVTTSLETVTKKINSVHTLFIQKCLTNSQFLTQHSELCTLSVSPQMTRRIKIVFHNLSRKSFTLNYLLKNQKNLRKNQPQSKEKLRNQLMRIKSKNNLKMKKIKNLTQVKRERDLNLKIRNKNLKKYRKKMKKVTNLKKNLLKRKKSKNL